MWARWVEIACGLWLAGSAVVFTSAERTSGLVLAGLGLGGAVVALAAACHWHPFRRAHLALLAPALAIAAVGWWGVWTSERADVVYQSWLVTGLVLAMTSIVPSDASTPPETWRRPMARRARPEPEQ